MLRMDESKNSEILNHMLKRRKLSADDLAFLDKNIQPHYRLLLSITLRITHLLQNMNYFHDPGHIKGPSAIPSG